MRTDGERLVVELSSVYVQCDDCGHFRVLRPSSLARAAALGVHTYRELARKVRCSQCPPQPPSGRNLTLRPTWFCDKVFQTSA